MTLATVLIGSAAALLLAFVNFLTGSHHDPVLIGIWAGAGCAAGWSLRDEREVEG